MNQFAGAFHGSSCGHFYIICFFVFSLLQFFHGLIKRVALFGFFCGSLTFSAPDLENFPCLALAYRCAKLGGTACPVMNGANEEAVAMFLRDEIGFYDIYRLVSAAVDAVPFIPNPTLEEILESDRLARLAVRKLAKP